MRFIVDHEGWPRPFVCPRVSEFVIASDEDGTVWELESEDSKGIAARELAFVLGEAPPGFRQVSPENNARPKPLTPGRTYYVAAGKPKGVYYRMVFALPLSTLEMLRGSPFATTRPGSLSQ